MNDLPASSVALAAPTRSLRSLLASLALVALALLPALAQDSNEFVPGKGRAESYEELVAKAEKSYDEASFTEAKRAYERAAKLDLTDEQRRWVEFRIADTTWRASAATNEADQTEPERAKAKLEELVAAVGERVEDRDLVWAEAHLSLGGYFWGRQRSQDWGAAWPHYEAALAWWGGSSDLERARRRYLDAVFEAAMPPYANHWNRASYASYLPQDVLENAVRIAVDVEDVATTRFLLGSFYQRQGQNLMYRGRVERELGAVIELGKASEWYDDALYGLASFLQSTGRATRDEDRAWRWKVDYVDALALYRRLTKEFEKGESAWYDQARHQIEEITRKALQVGANRTFLPGSEVAFDLWWRNVDRVELELYRVDLTRDVTYGRDLSGWLERISVGQNERYKRWEYATGDDGTHVPGSATLDVGEQLPVGAYVLVASGGGESARTLVLVSDLALTTKAANGTIFCWVTDALTGAPVPGADLALWHRSQSNERTDRRAVTGDDGTFTFRAPGAHGSCTFFVAARAGQRQAYDQRGTYHDRQQGREWRILAHTDRSAYRPGHLVRWKATARVFDATGYSTPADRTLSWRIVDPRGADVATGDAKLDEFGCAWGEVETTAEMALGEYHVIFSEANDAVGRATLFRLEEYKLPEFEVTVDVLDDPETGEPKRFLLGDTVEAAVDARYYFGGAVANAKVEVFVHQNALGNLWPVEREYPWFYDDTSSRQYYGWRGTGQQVSHQVLTTDAEGRASFSFETPVDALGDFEYSITARVTDASRREIAGSGSVRVTQAEYSARVRSEHSIHRPGSKVELEVETRDANRKPYPTSGKIVVARERRHTIWVDPAGREVRREDLPDGWSFGTRPGWNLKVDEVEREVVETIALTTGEDGEASCSFVPKEPGSYVARWIGIDGRDNDVTAEVRVWVADENTKRLGVFPDGIEILIDQDTLEVGRDATFLLSAPASGRWVLVTLESETLLHHEVVKLDGSVKLMRLPMTEAHVPNVWLSALSIWDGEAHQDTEQLVVPPTKQFLDVEIVHDDEVHVPGTRGSVTVRVRDHAGNPVRAQLSIGVVDDALAYIQGDYAGDPRQFYFGQRRTLRVRTYGSFYRARFDKLSKNERGSLVDKNGFVAVDRDDQPVEEAAEADGYFLGLGERRAKASLSALGYASGPSAPGAAAPQEMADAAGRQEGGNYQGPGDSVPPLDAGNVRVRSDFRETALWDPAVVTDADGTATLEIDYPDSTTRWSTTVRTIDAGTRVGIGEAETRTRQPLIARLQAPRFFLVGDELTLSGNVNNNTEEAVSARVALAVEEGSGLELLGRIEGGELVKPEVDALAIPAGGEARVDWRVRVTRMPESSEALVRLTALAGEVGDAIERKYPVFPHGIEALVATSGKFDAGSIAFDVTLPKERAPGTSDLRVQVTPSLAVTMLDALPYLIDYPYGCTEQTLSRFLPTVIVSKTLADLGLSREDAVARVFGGIEQGSAAATHPDGKRALAEMDAMVAQALSRLYEHQLGDGGWAWWKSGDGNAFMTAYTVWGLTLAKEAGIEIRGGVLENGTRWLAREIVEAERDPDLQAWMLHAYTIATEHGIEPGDSNASKWTDVAYANLMKKREVLSAYGRALLALSAHMRGTEADAKLLATNLIDGAIVDESTDTSIVQVDPQAHREYALKTAHWGEDGIYHRWSDGGVEATAWALRALVAIDPKHELVEPAANWLVQNRRGAQWSNTRDTAIVVLALNDYVRGTGQLASGVSYRVVVNEQVVGEVELAAADLLRAPAEFVVDEALVRSGANTIRIERTAGDAPLYFAAYARFFSEEEPIPARGNQIFVRREYTKLVGRKTLLEGYVYDRVPLVDGDRVTSGERIEVTLTIEAKNNLEYLVFEDLKPAGFEAVQIRSGEALYARERERGRVEEDFAEGEQHAGSGYTSRRRFVHQELRDRKVALFVDRLDDGFWEIRYELRAETPGSFHALPVLGHAMYVPEVRCNGREMRFEVLDAPSE